MRRKYYGICGIETRKIIIMKRFLYTITILCGLLLFFSCSDSLLGNNADKTLNDINIKSLKTGSILKKGQGVTFSVVSPGGGDIPDKLVINLSTMTGESVKKLESKTFALNSDLNLDPFDSIQTGQYRIEFQIYTGENLLVSKNISFFYADSDFNLKGVESFPSGIYPGAHVLLKSGLAIPATADPFLRWTIGDKTIAKGRMSEGKSKIIWTAPDDEGVYTVRVELFPVAPTGADDFGFKSDVFMDVEVYVSKMQAPSRLKLLPDTSYYSLFHLDGNFNDTGNRTNEQAAKGMEKSQAFPIGSPELVTKEDDFGYTINNSAGLTIPYSVFPTADGRLAPFTLSMGLDLDAKQKDKTVFSYVSDDNSFSLVISIDSFTNLSGQMNLDSQIFIFPSEINVSNLEKRFMLSLSVIPTPAKITALWYIDGIRTNKIVIAMPGNRSVGTTGVATIGGDHSISGTIDELGTYYKDGKGRSTTNTRLYYSAMSQKYQDALIFAEGFEGLFVPDYIKTEGKAWMEEDGFSFESQAVIRIDNLPANNSPFSVALNFLSFADELGHIEFYWDKSDHPFLTVSSEGKILTGDTEAPKNLASASKTVRFKIHENDTLVSFAGDKALSNLLIEKSVQAHSQLTIKIVNTDLKKPVSLDSITLYKEKK
jgi:hypothetical protein